MHHKVKVAQVLDRMFDQCLEFARLLDVAWVQWRTERLGQGLYKPQGFFVQA